MAKTSDKIEREMAAAALQKRKAGLQPTREEIAALRRIERDREEAQRWEYMRTIPKKHWLEMSGRQAKVINSQAARYGLPFGESPIDLPKVVRALHDFLATNATRLTGDTAGDPLLVGGNSPALERYRDEQWRIAKIKRHEMEGDFIARDTVHESLARLAALLRQAGELLQKQYGTDAQAILDETLDEWARLIPELLGGENGDD